ncbi:hypothetical protein OSTOST_24813, partial [Ostertagia ostertagi]
CSVYHGSSIKFHGSLYLSNCVVDANWVVKLTDFGLQEIIWDKMLHKELACFQGADVDHLPIKYLQLPPEMLRNVLAEGLLSRGSAKTDIYQLGNDHISNSFSYETIFGKLQYDHK